MYVFSVFDVNFIFIHPRVAVINVTPEITNKISDIIYCLLVASSWKAMSNSLKMFESVLIIVFLPFV